MGKGWSHRVTVTTKSRLASPQLRCGVPHCSAFFHRDPVHHPIVSYCIIGVVRRITSRTTDQMASAITNSTVSTLPVNVLSLLSTGNVSKPSYQNAMTRNRRRSCSQNQPTLAHYPCEVRVIAGQDIGHGLLRVTPHW